MCSNPIETDLMVGWGVCSSVADLDPDPEDPELFEDPNPDPKKEQTIDPSDQRS